MSNNETRRHTVGLNMELPTDSNVVYGTTKFQLLLDDLEGTFTLYDKIRHYRWDTATGELQLEELKTSLYEKTHKLLDVFTGPKDSLLAHRWDQHIRAKELIAKIQLLRVPSGNPVHQSPKE